MGSILLNFLICSEMCSKVVLRLTGAILNGFCTNLGIICDILAEIENFRKCAKIFSVSSGVDFGNFLNLLRNVI